MPPPDSRDLVTSAVTRLLRVAGLAGRVGASVLGSRALDLARSEPDRARARSANLVLNATRIVETLGELKGATMKLGQMLSLHEGLLPPEAAAVLRALQREAPRVPAEVMEYEIRGALPDFDDLFASLEPDGFAAASIGQVHRGRLADGRPVAVKIQYPLIREIVEADLKNLRTLLKALLGLLTEMEFEPIWNEVRDRLLEELDYTHEAANAREAARLFADFPDVVIPRVVDEATTTRVLTMELVGGLPADEACSSRQPRELRDRWGRVLFEFMFRGLFAKRFLHADPNLANFAFREDGRIVVYDFGCVKRVPEPIALGFARLTMAGIEGRGADVPAILAAMGVDKEGGEALPRSVTDPYFERLARIYREAPPYTFGEDPAIYRDFFEMKSAHLSEAAELRFPRDLVFVNRTLAGHFGNLNRLEATGPWREIAGRLAGPLAGRAPFAP